MKKAEFVQIKGLDVKELKEKAKTLKKEIADLVMDKNMKKLKDVKLISKKRKETAQILTVLRQKELMGQLESKMQQGSSNKTVIASKAKQSSQGKKPVKIATDSSSPRNDTKKRSKKS